jgi:hypothetical protein
MALADTGKAIGKVTELLLQHLLVRTSLTVTVGRPEPPAGGAGGAANPRLNLFLYEIQFDPTLKNLSLDDGQQPPLWLVLRYLLTSFDTGGNSDSVEAQENMGLGLRALQEVAFLPLDTIALPPGIQAALKDNPEPLKVTFDPTSSELLARLMQSSEQKYRLSVGFQVRPVMIASGDLPDYSLLVGIDYTTTPPTVVGQGGVNLPIIPSLGPVIERVEPERFEPGATLTLYGNDLHLSGLSVRLGAAVLGVTGQRPDRLTCVVNGAIPGGVVVSAGSLPLSVAMVLPGGKTRSSNLLAATLQPVLLTVATAGLHAVTGNIAGDLILTGTLLGRDSDDIFVALYRDGGVVALFDGPFAHTPDQTGLTLTIPDTRAVPPGAYRVILRVNGQQARSSPEVNLV